MSSLASADLHKQQLEVILVGSIRNYIKNSKYGGNLPAFPETFAAIEPSHFRLYVAALLNDILAHEGEGKMLSVDAAEASSMSNVFRICEEIVSTLKELGMRSKITFRDLMHPNEQVIREILKWINERLNSFETVESDSQPLGTETSKEVLKKKLLHWKKQWSPPAVFSSEHTRKRNLAVHPKTIQYSNCQNISSVISPYRHNDRLSILSHNFLDITRSTLLLDEWEKETGGIISKEEYHTQKLQHVQSKIKGILSQEVEKEVESKNVDELLETQFTAASSSKGESLSQFKDTFKSAFANQKFFEMSDEAGTGSGDFIKNVQETEEQVIERRQNEEKEAQQAVETVVAMTQKLVQQIEQLKEAEVQIQVSAQEQKTQKKKLQEQYKITAQTFNLFKDRENALPEMQKISSQSAQRLLELATEWEEHRVPLLKKYHQLREEIENRKKSFKETLEVLKQKRNNVRNAIQDVKEKEKVTEEMKSTIETLPTNVSRSDFVSRIFDIVRNIENQRIEIAKILAESRELQRVIDKISEQLSGTFREAEKKIFEVAEKDAAVAEVYTNVIQLRNLFENIIKAIQEKGQCITSVRDSETQQEAMSKRVSENLIEQAAKDLEMIKRENYVMIQEIKQKKAILQGS